MREPTASVRGPSRCGAHVRPGASVRGTDAPGRRFAVDGVGAGWRPELAGGIATAPRARLYRGHRRVGRARRSTSGGGGARERGMQVVPHGISLSLGGAERPDPARLDHLASVAERVDAPLVSEHIAFVRAGGREAGHLLPVPRTREALESGRERRAGSGRADGAARAGADRGAVRLARRRVAEADSSPSCSTAPARCCCSTSPTSTPTPSTGQTRVALLDRVPLDRIAYVHVAGGAVPRRLYHDTHTDPVPVAGAGAGGGAVLRHRPPAADARARRRLSVRGRAAFRTGCPRRQPPPRAVSPHHHGESRVSPPADRIRRHVRRRRHAEPPTPTSDGAVGRRGRPRWSPPCVAGAPVPAGFDHRPARRRPAVPCCASGPGEVARSTGRCSPPSLGDALVGRPSRALGGRPRPPAGSLRDGWDLARALRAEN